MRYVKSSPSKLAKCKKVIKDEHITHKALMCLDMQTRWNSTYKMLVTAKNYQKAFERLEENDTDYFIHFLKNSKRVGPPTTAN